MKSQGVKGLEAAELRKTSEGIGCKDSVRREPQLNPVGANRAGTYPHVLARATTKLVYCCVCAMRLLYDRFD